MNQPINFVTLFASILSAIKLIAQPFGVDIPDEHINSIVNGAASLMVVIGIFMSHRKPNPVDPQPGPIVPQVEYKETSFR